MAPRVDPGVGASLGVALIIPTYNRAGLIGEAIDSALSQTHPCRVFVIDDGSTDHTEQVVRSFGQRVVYARQDNAERGVARNHGARLAASADALIFLDSDDLFLPDHVARLARVLDADPGLSFAASGYTIVDEKARPLQIQAPAPGAIALADFLYGAQPVGPPLALVRRAAFESVGGFPEDRALAGSEDWLFFGRLLARGRGERVAGAGAHIRQHGSQSMRNAESMRRSMLATHALLFADPVVAARPDAAWLSRRTRAHLLVSAGVTAYSVGDMRGARRDLALAIRESPEVLADARVAWTALRSLAGAEASARLRGVRRRVERALASRRAPR